MFDPLDCTTALHYSFKPLVGCIPLVEKAIYSVFFHLFFIFDCHPSSLEDKNSNHKHYDNQWSPLLRHALRKEMFFNEIV